MNKKHVGIIIVVLAIIVIIPLLLFASPEFYCAKSVDGSIMRTSCGNADLNKAEYCYTASFGAWMHNGTPNEICNCEGVFIVPTCPYGASCDGYDARCAGSINGVKYIFREYIEGKTYYQEFDTLRQYEEYCNSLVEPSAKQSCLSASAQLISMTVPQA